MKLDHEKMKEMLEAEGFDNVHVEPSGMTGSPHDYVYVYLTKKEHLGKHIIISEASEHGGRGLNVGVYPHFEKNGRVETAPHMDHALTLCKRMRGDFEGVRK